jgi:hypothetical protein
MGNKKLLELLLISFFTHQLQMKIFHFQTKIYSHHKLIDKYLDKFEKRLDKFMEVGQGIFGKFDIKKVRFDFDTIDDNNILGYLDKFIEVLKQINKFGEWSDLINIRDDILGDVNQFKYLLTFR